MVVIPVIVLLISFYLLRYYINKHFNFNFHDSSGIALLISILLCAITTLIPIRYFKKTKKDGCK